MAFRIIKQDETTAITVSSSDVLVIQRGVTVTSSLDGINGFNATDLTIINHGVVAGDLIGASVSSRSVVTVGDEGVFYGSATGLWLNGSNAAVYNAGIIQSRGQGLADIRAGLGLYSASGALIDNSGAIIGGNFGIELYGSTNGTTIINSGRITSVNAAITGGGTLRLENSGTVVSGSAVAVSFDGTDDALRILNTGTISGATAAILTGSGADQVTNRGTLAGAVILGDNADRLANRGDIVGDVDLGEGADRYTASGNGFVDGLVSGGAGDDELRGGRSDDRLAGSNGADQLFGGAGDDVLLGGADADTIAGGSGMDRIEGGLGNDVLRGDAGADTFVFADGTGADVVLDFQRARGDVIDLSGASAIADFADLAANHLTFVDGDAVIDLGGGDTVTLAGIDPAVLTASHFAF